MSGGIAKTLKPAGTYKTQKIPTGRYCGLFEVTCFLYEMNYENKCNIHPTYITRISLLSKKYQGSLSSRSKYRKFYKILIYIIKT